MSEYCECCESKARADERAKTLKEVGKRLLEIIDIHELARMHHRPNLVELSDLLLELKSGQPQEPAND